MARRIDRLLSGVSRSALGAAFALALAVAPAAADNVKKFNIPVQEATTAIRTFGQQAGLQVLASVDDLKGKRVNAVVGQLDVNDALRQLLANTGLTWRATDANTILIEKPHAAAIAPPAPASQDAAQEADKEPQSSDESKQAAEEDRKVERVVVTGTHIRGKRPKSSPLDIYTKEDIERSGATTTEQFIQKLPQNLNSRNSTAPDADGAFIGNREAINGVDLRGLGIGTTLVLLNGRRVTTAGDAQVVDISMIPVSALERVEVLTDGASAIYGSDAVGGVVNFILRNDLDGVETRGNYAGVTSGGLRQGGATVSAGTQWSGGNALASLNFFSASALENADRSYASARPGTLTPTDQRAGGFASFDQEIGENITLSGDFAYAQRAIKSEFTGPNNLRFTVHSDSDQFFGNLSTQVDLTSDLHASAHVTYSENDTDNVTRFVTNAGVATTRTPDTYGRTTDVTVMLDGAALALPAGDVRFSIGGGVTHERFAGRFVPRRDMRRDTTYAFGELFVPLLSEDMNVSLAQSLELSLAARYTNYEDASSPALGVDFGSSISPKLGLLWSPIEGFTLRGTYGESFRAAPLNQLDPTSARNSIFMPSAFGFPDIWSPTGQTTTLNLTGGGGNPNLEPETAQSYTLGFDLEPPPLEGLQISATYFNIEYQNRIATPDTAGLASVRPQDFPDLFIVNPTATQIEEVLRNSTNFFNTSGINLADPAAAAAQLAALPSVVILDNRVRNLARSDVEGLDFSIRQSWTPSIGEVTVGAQATYIFDYEQQVTPNAAVLTVVDTVLQPSDLRGTIYVSLSTERVDTRLAANYVDDYDNPFSAAQPHVDSWTTIDWSGSYRLGGDHDGALLRLSVQNLFDEDPPFVAQRTVRTDPGLAGPIGFDPRNANPLGRFVSFEVVKKW